MSSLFGGTLTLSFLLLTCTSSAIMQVPGNIMSGFASRCFYMKKFIQPVLFPTTVT